jgi:amino acid adenylation domain-containing protein
VIGYYEEETLRRPGISNEKAVAARQYGKEKDYWLDKLAGDLVKTGFPYDYQTREKDELVMESLEFSMTHEIFEKLIKTATGRNHRIHMILLAVLVVLLEKYTGYHDIIIGSPIYKQKFDGEFINTALALRTQLSRDGKMSFKELLLDIRQSMIEAVDNQNYPIETLVYQLNLPEYDKEFSLFDVVLLLENIHDKAYIDHINCNMRFSFLRTGKGIEGKLEYNPFRYKKTTVERIILHFTCLLQGVLRSIDAQLDQLTIISQQEKERVLVEFNSTTMDYPKEIPIRQLFEEQAEKTPDRLALVGSWQLAVGKEKVGGAYTGKQTQITYKELNKASNQLARLLIEKQVCCETILGLMVEPSLEMVIGLLGILKAGAAYLPIDPLYPEERKKHIIKEANITLLFTNCEDKNVTDLSNDVVEVLRLNTPGLHPVPEPNHVDFENKARWNSVVYIIYTSGSTGVPKGVMVEHRNVVRLVKNTNFINFNRNDRILQTGALEFDASTFEIWGALLNGLTLYLEDKEKVLAPGCLKKAIKKYQITTIWMTSPLFNHMAQEDIEIFAGLTNLLVGGDVLSPIHINGVRERFPGLRVINGYGPTENTTFSTTFLIDKAYEDSIPIGSPIANSTAYILDKYGNLQPINVPGELYVGGDGAARGYLNDPELTDEKFLVTETGFNQKFLRGVLRKAQSAGRKTPCAMRLPPGRRRLYKTGDLARWLLDGNIEFLGRMDHQVKIRGFRVELGEIEIRLAKHPDINEVVVLARQNEQGEKYLCAYFVPCKELTVSQLIGYLSEELPDYMIPAYFVPLEQLPCTPNGKIHRQMLPDPKNMIYTGKTYEPPANDIEEKILQTWSEVLGLDPGQIGTGDDFFELGGNSINILKVQSQLNKQFPHDISLSFMFIYPTIRELAANLQQEPLINKLEHIVKLNKGDNKKNIFLFHPLHGMTYPFKELAGLLEDHYNVYGIQGKGLQEEVPLPRSYNEMLADYLPQVKAVQAAGPYILGGFCIGGELAYEAARELEDEGEIIEKVIMLDIRAFILEEVIRFYRLKKAIYSGSTGIFSLFKRKKSQSRQDAAQPPQTPHPPPNKEERLKQRVEANNKALSLKYKYKRLIHSPILHIRSQENHLPGLEKKYWVKMTKGNVDCFESPGDHDTMLNLPHVKKLAEIIKKSL